MICYTNIVWDFKANPDPDIHTEADYRTEQKAYYALWCCRHSAPLQSRHRIPSYQHLIFLMREYILIRYYLKSKSVINTDETLIAL
jgi:hypothetical protein